MNQEEQAVVEETPAAGNDASEVSPTEAQETQTPEQAPTEGSEDPEPASTGDAPQPEEKKSTRAERRVHQLLGKLQGKDEGQVQPEAQRSQTNTVSDVLGLGQTPPWWQQQQEQSSLFQPGTEVSPEQLEQEINRRAATAAELQLRRILSERDQQHEYKARVQDYTGDLERVIAEAPEFNDDQDREFEKRFVDLYESLNFDNGQFAPRKKASAIYESLLSVRNSGRTSGQKETTARMAESQAQQAIAPTGGTSDKQSSELDTLRENALESGSDEAWAAYLKRKIAK